MNRRRPDTKKRASNTSDGRQKSDDLAYGIHAVQELLNDGGQQIRQVLVDSGAGAGPAKLAQQAKDMGLEVRVLPSKAFGDLAKGRPFQGIAAKLAPFEYVDLDQLIAPGQSRSFLVALDQVQDPQNFGSILRTAAFFGAAGVIIPQDRQVFVTPAVIRASAGGAMKVPVAKVVNLARALRACTDAGFTVIGAAAAGGVTPSKLPPEGPFVLVLGSEGAGLRRLVQESCQVLVTIPSPGEFESLNVGVAAGILMSALVGH